MKIAIVVVAALAIALSMGLAIAPAAYADGAPAAPANMSVMDIGKGYLFFTWDKGDGADNTVIVGKIGSYPEDRDDGAVIYNGNGSSFTDGVYDLDYETFYVRAWSENSSVYSLTYDELTAGGTFMDGMLLIIFIALGAALMLAGAIKGYPWILGVSMIPWILTVIYCLDKYSETGDVLWQGLSLFGIVMILAAIFMALTRGAGGEKPEGPAIYTSAGRTRKRWIDRVGEDD